MSLTDLQHRLTLAENAIVSLTDQVQKLSGYSSHSVKTAIPLQRAFTRTLQRGGRMGTRLTRPEENDQENYTPTPLSVILAKNEEVTFTINTGKDGQGNYTTTTAVAIFDGTNLKVTECQDIPSLVGLTSSKPGEILYKFMNDLKEANLITRTFQALPWRLCSVERDGQRVTLSNLRKALTEENDA
jgi:hypothetical protein